MIKKSGRGLKKVFFGMEVPKNERGAQNLISLGGKYEGMGGKILLWGGIKKRKLGGFKINWGKNKKR